MLYHLYIPSIMLIFKMSDALYVLVFGGHFQESVSQEIV